MQEIDVASTACPQGQFSAPAYCDADAYSIHAGPGAPQDQQQPGSSLLEQLQDCNCRAQRLLTLLSIHREQGIAAHADGVDRLFAEALACIVHALQAAAAAKQPLLTASSQHSSCFCKLLERLHLLDALWKASNPGPTPGMQEPQQQAGCAEIEAAVIQAAAHCPAAPFINQLESQLRGTPGLDVVLAALVAHAQQNAAAGSKLGPGALVPQNSKAEVLEVSCMSAVQEHHSSARALPLLIRLYFNTGSRAETIAAGKPEPLTAKLLERSLAVLAAKPVVPGCADVPVCLTSGLQACQGLSELAAARKLKLPTELGKLDFKAAFKLDQSYSLQGKVLPLLQQHDELCDLLSQLALEIQQAVAVERDIDPKALDNAEQLVSGSISFAAAARNSLLDLDAWRLSTCGAGTESATPTSAYTQPEHCLDGCQAGASDMDSTCDRYTRYKLKNDDVVAFMDVLGAVKGLTGLLSESSSWLQPLLQEHAVKQLNDFAFSTLPALSKVYARNPRLQDLLRAIYACIQGQFVEVGEDVDAPAALPSPPAAAADAAFAAGGSEFQLQQQGGRPLAEGFEGLKERWGSLKGSSRKQAQQQAAAAAAAGQAGAAAEEAVQAAAAADDSVQQPVPEGPSAAAHADAVESAALHAAAAADVEAAAAAAAAAATEAFSRSSSPCSVTQVQVKEAVQLQAPGPIQQGHDTAVQGSPRAVSSDAAIAAAAAVAAACSDGAAPPAGEAAAADTEAAVTEEAMQQTAASSASQPSRKRTFKGLFKLKASGRKKDKAAAQEAAAAGAAAAAELAVSSGGASAAALAGAAISTAASAGGDCQSVEAVAVRLEQQQQGEQSGSAKPGRRPAPSSAYAWTDSENDMLLCHIRPQEVTALPSAASSMTDLNSAGFERPPDLPFELQGATAGSDNSPRSVAHAAAMFERIAAVNRQLAAASDRGLSNIGRMVTGGSKSSPGGWEAPASSTAFPARLSEVAGSPLSREELLEAAGVDAEQHPGKQGVEDSPLAGSTSQQQADSMASPAKVAKRRQGLFGLRSLLPGRTPDAPQQDSRQEPVQDAAVADKQLSAVQQEKEQLAEQLQGKQEPVVLLSGQELDGLQSCPADDAAIPASWGQAPVSPLGKQRMKGMLSMLRRGGARTASAGAAAALLGDASTPATADAAAATSPDEQLAELSAAVAAAEFGGAGADVIAAGVDVAAEGSQCGSQPDASEDFDEDQPSKTRRVMGLMNRIRVFTQGTKEQQPAVQQVPQQQAGDAAGNRQGLKGLKFTAKLKKAMGDRRQSRFADVVGVDGQTQLPLVAMPSAACLQLLRVLLELLMQEIKAETKKHLMMQLQMAAAAAAGSAGVKPDASIARPLKQVKQMIRAVHRMQQMVDFPKQLLAAADVSDLWVGACCGSNLASMAVAAAATQQQEAPPAPAAAAGSSSGPWQSAGSASKQGGEGGVKVSVDLSPPSPKGLHPWSLYNLLFEENSENSLGEGVRNSLGALSLSNFNNRSVAEAPADSPATAQQGADAAEEDCSQGHDSCSPWAVPHLSSFPSALITACMQRLEQMPAEVPLLALQVLWDARRLLNSCGLLQQGLVLLQEQEKLCMCIYMQHLVPTAYEHFKRIAGHQIMRVELLQSCKAAPLQPVKQLYLDSLLREACPLVMQGDYAAVAAEAAATLRPGQLAAADAQLAETLTELDDAVQELQKRSAVADLQRAVDVLQQVEQGEQQAADGEQPEFLTQELPVSDQQDPAGGVRFSGVFTAAKPSPGKTPMVLAAEGSPSPGPSSRSARKKRQGRATSKQRSSAAGLPGQKGASPGPHSVDNQQAAGVTPLMQKLEGMQLEHEAYAAAGRYREWACLQAWGASELDVRQWLLAGMLQSLQQDAAVVVARCRCERPTAIVESQQHAAILQRTHELLSQYTPLPQSWDQIWQEADSQQDTEDAGTDTSSAAACVAGLLNMLNTAVYDSEAQVLLPSADTATDAVPAVDGVLSEVERAVQPQVAFFGRQHLTALHALTGPAGVQQLVAGVLDKLEQEQASLLEELLSLQQQLPPSLLQLPSAEDHHSAGAVLQFYQQQLSSALQDHAACAAALGSLQRIGNCLALLHLLSIQQAVWATPQFMQVAPLLGIVGRPMVDAAAAAECFEGEELPEPPSALASAAAVSSGCHNLAKACTPGLLMPEVETLLPSDHARHTHEMQALKELHQEDVCRWEARQAGQPLDNTLVKPGGELARHRVWQASHFQRLLLGPDAEKVRGPAMLLTQTAELRAWRATQGVDVMGPCLQRVQEWAVQLQQQLQGERDARRHKGGRRAGRSRRRKGAAAEGVGADSSRKSSRSQHRLRQQLQEGGQIVDLSPALQAATLRSGAGSRAAAAAAVKALSAETSAGPSAEPSASTLGPMTDPAGDGDLTEVEQQLQVLQAQVNAALIAAEERLRVVSMSPPSALLTEERPRVQLPPQPIPFNLEQGTAGLAQQGSGDTGDHPAAVLEAEDSVEQASPRAGTFSGVEAASCNLASSSGTAATVPAFLTEQELSAAAEAAATAARLPGNPWDAAGSAAAQLPAGSVPSAHAKLAYKLLAQSATTSAQEGAEGAVLSQDEDEAGVGTSSARTGLAELVEELSDIGSLGSRPATNRSGYREAHMPDQFQAQQASSSGQAPGAEPGAEKAAAVDSPHSAPASPRRGVFVSCPGRCENGEEDDAASECDTRSPRSPWQQQCIPSPARSPSPQLSPSRQSRMFGDEGSYLMATAVADEQHWEDRSQQESPMRYPTPPITELLYETTCDELVRVKDERDMLMSEVEILRNQLKNRDNTLAMLSGQMLITPRTSAADCESLMRAAMSECSVGSMAMRSQPAVSGAASLHGNTVSMGTSANGTQALRGGASAHQLGSADGSEAAAAAASAARTPQSARSARQQLSRPRSGVQTDEQQACQTGATVSAEASEVRPEHSKSSVRVQQATPCADIVSTVEGGSATPTAEQSTCSHEDDGYLSSSCTDSDYSSCTDEDTVGLAAVDSCLDSRAPCGASRKLKMPHTIKRSSSSSSSQDPSPWPPAQLAVALSALKFALLLDVASGADSTPEGPRQDAQGSAGGAPTQSPPLRRLRKGVEGGDAAAGAAGVSQAAAAATQQQQDAASKQGMLSRGSGRMTTALYGDGPLLASAVLLQLSGQARRFEVLDAAGRIAHWVEYDAVKASSSASRADSTAGAEAAASAAGNGVTSPRGVGAASLAPSGVAAIVGAPGGIGPAAEGIAPPKPRSKKKQDEVAEALVREQAAAAAQQLLLERLAAAHRQALRVSRDGSSFAARFAPAAAARSQKVRLRVFRVDGAAVQQLQRSAGGASAAGSSSPGRITFGGGMGGMMAGAGAASASHSSGGGSAEQPKVPAVPVRAATLQFYPRQQPWAGVRPTQQPIKTHPALPMARPQPLLLSAGPGGGPARPAGAAEGGFVPPAVANLPREAAAAAAAAAAAGTGIVGPSGKLLTGASVAPRAGLVAAARVMAAREVLLQSVPRNAAYSFSVVSDQNRSGRPEDGYSMAPSSADLDSLGPESPRRSPHRPSFMSAAMGASAARLGGRQRAAGPAGAEAGGTSMEQWLAGSAAAAGGGLTASQDGSPSKGSPTKRGAAAGQSGLLARAFG